MRHGLPHALLAVASAVLLAGCGSAGAPEETAPAVERFAYGPFRATYEGVSHGTVEQMGQSITFGVRFFLSAAAAGAGDAARLTLTVDSIPELAGQGATAEDAAAAAGMTFSGILSPTGEIVTFRGGEDAESQFVQQLRTGFQRFFPLVPEGGAAPGATWTDSVQTTSGGSDMEILVEMVTRSEALAWVDYGGQRALHVLRVSDYVLSGAGSQMGTEFTIDGTGVRHEHRYLSASGVYLGGTAADTSNATAVVAAMGMEIPILQIQSDTLRVVG